MPDPTHTTSGEFDAFCAGWEAASGDRSPEEAFRRWNARGGVAIPAEVEADMARAAELRCRYAA